MNKRKRAYFRKILNGRLEELLKDFGKTVNGMSNFKAVFSDPTDRASLESDRNFLLRIRDRERKLIVKIHEALSRIDEGSFGVCGECGNPISEQRLKARPVTTLCIDCKQEAEVLEKKCN